MDKVLEGQESNFTILKSQTLQPQIFVSRHQIIMGPVVPCVRGRKKKRTE